MSLSINLLELFQIYIEPHFYVVIPFLFPHDFGLIRGEETDTRQTPSLRKKKEALVLLYSHQLASFTHDQLAISFLVFLLCTGFHPVLLCGLLVSSLRPVATRLLRPRQHGRSEREIYFRPAPPISPPSCWSSFY